MFSFLFSALFVLGLIIGSFLNVLSLRYEPDRSLLDWRALGGRSHCPYCGVTLQWRELVPLLSFLAQKGKCRTCGRALTWQYPMVELLSGFIASFTPLFIFRAQLFSYVPLGAPASTLSLIAAAWTFVFLLLLLLAVIDFHHSVIPDGLNAALAFLGIVLIGLLAWADRAALAGAPAGHSFIGHYAWIFGAIDPLWLNRIAAAVMAPAFFALVIALTRGKGMGWGDVKLAAALGLLFGWPDITLVLALSFIVGALTSVALMARGARGMKDAVPFGPFLVVGAMLAVACGFLIMRGYFWLFRIA